MKECMTRMWLSSLSRSYTVNRIAGVSRVESCVNHDYHSVELPKTSACAMGTRLTSMVYPYEEYDGARRDTWRCQEEG